MNGVSDVAEPAFNVVVPIFWVYAIWAPKLSRLRF